MDEKPRVQGIPIFLDDNEPAIDDPAVPTDVSYWFPANTISIKLATSIESLRDINRLLEVLAGQEDPWADKRMLKLFATPLYSFATSVKDLFSDIHGNASDYNNLSDKDRREVNRILLSFSKAVPLKEGTLRTIRDKISAHVDKDVFKGDPRKVWELVDLDLQLDWLRACATELLFLVELDIYAWTRESGNTSVFRLMSVDGVQVDLKRDERIISGVTKGRSPKYYIASKIQEIAHLYQQIKAKLI